MKKLLILIAVSCLTVLAACDFETSGNGDLDGFWHLEQIDTLATGGVSDLSQQQLFWGVQFHLLRMSNLADNDIVYRFEHVDDHLVLSAPSMFDRTDGDTLVTDLNVLRPFGIHALSERLTIVTLNADQLVLRSPLYQLHFVKY